MEVVRQKSDFDSVNDNIIKGEYPELINSTIKFEGKNNLLFCEPGVVLESSSIYFGGNNAVVYIRSSIFHTMLNISVFSGSVFHLGKDCYFNKPMTVILSSDRNFFIGDDCIFSTGISVRTADPHLIYDCSTKKRINETKSVFLGDHVWVGQDCTLLKGTEIDSGSIIGAACLITGKKIPHNSSWAGVPAKLIKDNVFWDRACVNNWDEAKVNLSSDYTKFAGKFRKDTGSDAWIYSFRRDESISFSQLDKDLISRKDSLEKYEYLYELNSKKIKNRFVHNIAFPKKRFKLFGK